jgi:prophage regulatory protein
VTGSRIETVERFIKLAEVVRRCGLGKTMIYEKMKEGTFPKAYKLSIYATRWSEREITAWIDDIKDGYEGKRRQI